MILNLIENDFFNVTLAAWDDQFKAHSYFMNMRNINQEHQSEGSEFKIIMYYVTLSLAEAT